MSKGRRTKKQKMTARHGMRYALKLTEVAPEIKPVASAISHQNTPISGRGVVFSYDPRLIKADLTKTLLLSILAIATIVVIYLLRLI